MFPSVVLDTSVGGDPIVKPPKTEDDHSKQHENLRNLCYGLRERILKDINSDITFNPAPQDYIAVMRRKTFIAIYSKKKWIWLTTVMRAMSLTDYHTWEK